MQIYKCHVKRGIWSHDLCSFVQAIEGANELQIAFAKCLHHCAASKSVQFCPKLKTAPCCVGSNNTQTLISRFEEPHPKLTDALVNPDKRYRDAIIYIILYIIIYNIKYYIFKKTEQTFRHST